MCMLYPGRFILIESLLYNFKIRWDWINDMAEKYQENEKIREEENKKVRPTTSRLKSHQERKQESEAERIVYALLRRIQELDSEETDP